MKNIVFTKMQATGNDFIVIDNRKPKQTKLPKLALKLCDRRFGIGADGLLVVEKSAKCDFKMRIFNPDGSEAEMCGNGIRCIALFAFKNKIAPNKMIIKTKAGRLKASVNKNKVKISMTDPKDIKLGLEAALLNNDIYQIHYVDTGVPHAVCFVPDVNSVDILESGRSIRYHGMFRPKGANVNFVEIKNKSKIKIRTYERGVEDETFACGTGAVASAIISGMVKNIISPVSVYTKGGLLKIYFDLKNGKIKNVFLEGEAEIVYNGTINV